MECDDSVLVGRVRSQVLRTNDCTRLDGGVFADDAAVQFLHLSLCKGTYYDPFFNDARLL